jgi:3-phosphoshikimate 1-carboxyvinyltransferase
MSLAVAATRCREDIILKDCMAVNKSYPDFWEDYKMLGGIINEFNDRQ